LPRRQFLLAIVRPTHEFFNEQVAILDFQPQSAFNHPQKPLGIAAAWPLPPFADPRLLHGNALASFLARIGLDAGEIAIDVRARLQAARGRAMALSRRRTQSRGSPGPDSAGSGLIVVESRSPAPTVRGREVGGTTQPAAVANA